MKFRKLTLGVMDIATLFEMVALCMIIHREKNKSLGHLLFQANQAGSEGKRFMKLEQRCFRFS
jgi:hypothetical protein